MEKVYVMFGELPKSQKYTNVYEGLLEENLVKIIMPTALFSTCQAMAMSIEYPAYVVEGKPSTTGKHGEPVLSDCRVISKLKFDKTTETYLYVKPRIKRIYRRKTKVISKRFSFMNILKQIEHLIEKI